MAVRGKDRISRNRKRARQRILGAAFVLLGILLWGVAATAQLKPEALTYAGITIGGAAVAAGIIMFATTLWGQGSRRPPEEHDRIRTMSR